MKFVAVMIICLIILGAVVIALKVESKGESYDQYLRIHIRANSNETCDQSVKYKVKENIVEYISPKLENITSKSQAMDILNKHLSQMKNVADYTLAQNGYDYQATIRLCKEEFPVRTYGDLTLDSGIYDALIIELGSGEGDNWWCVVFPPLCFVAEDTSEDDFEYKSFFEDMYNKYFAK